VPRFTTSLQFRDTGQTVTHLQEFLSENKAIYPSGRVTGYFGTLTLQAVERFQEKYRIAQVGDAGYGYVGPLTRAKLNSLLETGSNP
jgi:peptidoglycan hydrolase-like protein with peptidoglycan-binding domain